MRVFFCHLLGLGLAVHAVVKDTGRRNAGLCCRDMRDLLRIYRELGYGHSVGQVCGHNQGIYDCTSVVADQIDGAALLYFKVCVESTLGAVSAGIEQHNLAGEYLGTAVTLGD